MQNVTPQIVEKIFLIKKVKNTVPSKYVIEELHAEEIVGTFYEKECQKIIQTEFGVEKVIKEKSYKLYIKFRGYKNSLES